MLSSVIEKEQDYPAFVDISVKRSINSQQQKSIPKY